MFVLCLSPPKTGAVILRITRKKTAFCDVGIFTLEIKIEQQRKFDSSHCYLQIKSFNKHLAIHRCLIY